MEEQALFDFTEVSFRGKQYKFLKEEKKKTVLKPGNVRSRSVVTPFPEEVSIDEDALPLLSQTSKPPDSPVPAFTYDIEQIKHFGELPSEQFRTPHVDSLSPSEERRIFRILQSQRRSVEATQGRKLGQAVRGEACIQAVFQYFSDIKTYSQSPSKPVHFPKLRPRATRAGSIPLRSDRLLHKY